MQVQNGVEGFLEDNRLVTPLPADKLAWFTVGSVISGAQARRASETHHSPVLRAFAGFGFVRAAGALHLQGRVIHHAVSSHPKLPISRHISSVASVVVLLILQSTLPCALLCSKKIQARKDGGSCRESQTARVDKQRSP